MTHFFPRFTSLVRMTIVFVLLSASVLSLSAQGALFSHYGYQNLSAASGVPATVPVSRVETAIDGNVLHLLWVDEKVDGASKFWYRRSNDLGLSWESPVEVTSFTAASARRWKHMSASNGRVHIVAVEGDDLVCLTSGDGKEFHRQVLDRETLVHGHYAAFIHSVGDKVAVCYQSCYNNRKGIHIAYSEDGGVAFSDSLITHKYNGKEYAVDELVGFDYDGTSMAVLTRWNDRWHSDCIMWATTSADGKTFHTTQIVTDLYNEDGSIFHKGYNVNDDNAANEPYTSVAVSGQRVYVLTVEQLTNEDDRRYLTLHRSLDGGQSWAQPQQVCSEQYRPKDCPAYIRVQGDDVYILTEIGDYRQYEIRNLIFHSSDGGETFGCQTDWTETIHKRGHIADYTLCFDPSDASGKTLYMTGNDYAWVKTTDGFNTINAVSLNDSKCPDKVGFWKNLHTNLEIDASGTRHWFIRYRPAGADRHEVIYRRDAGEPAPGATNKALHIAPLTDEGYTQHRVLIPNNKNYHGTALTMEMWVKTDDTENDLTFAYLGSTSDQEPRYGISLGKDNDLGHNRFAANLCNDKEDRLTLMCKASELVPDRWHHLALTYDEACGKACFFVNGVLTEEKEFHGAIGWGWNPIVIGNPMEWSSKGTYYVDDFRLWNRALSAREIQENLHRLLLTADGLKVNQGFDDTLLDLSGNGNSGYGMADVDFVPSDIEVPTAGFDICQTETGVVAFSNHSKGADTYRWSFGDGKTSTLAQPTHVYDHAGEYLVSLEAGNATTFASTSQTLTVAGLSDIQPRRIGNSGKVLTTITGGGIQAGQTVSLVRNGLVIKADEVWEECPGILKAWFYVDGAELGRWSLSVGGATLNEAVIIEEARVAKPWMTFQNRGKILMGKWLTHTIAYGNKGNVDAYNVPLNFMITHYPDLEVEMIDFGYALPEQTIELFPDYYIPTLQEALKRDIGDYVIVKDAEGKEWRCYPFQVPIIKAGSSQEIHMRLKTTHDVQIKYWADESWGLLDDEAQQSAARREGNVSTLEAPSKSEQGNCIMNNIGMGVLDAVIDIIPFGGCAWGAAKTIYGVCTDDAKDRLYNLAWNMGTASLSCLTGGLNKLAKIGYITATSISMGGSALSALAGGARCTGGPANSSSLRAVTSWDPNEMIGPSQFMDADSIHWIASDCDLPYKILFENKKEATAPAHTVFVTDTLDIATLNLEDFAFTSVGWGDTLVTVPGQQRAEFSLDIDMRPAQPYIVRTTGKLDKENGIVNWLFVTLNPQTMDEEEDPEIGFLPPNNDDHVGEGFVSFIIGQKENLLSGTRIENQASIVFDANRPILTNRFVCGVDTDLPSSAAYLVSEYDDDHLQVQWSGNDASSGVAWYDVYVSTDNDFYEPVIEMLDGESALIEREPDTKYYFYTVVTDHVGNAEQKTGTYDVMYEPTSIHSLRNDLFLTRKGQKAYEVLLPDEAVEVTLRVYSSDGRKLQSQPLGSGSRFNVVLHSSEACLLVLEADGQRYAWKLAPM